MIAHVRYKNYLAEKNRCYLSVRRIMAGALLMVLLITSGYSGAEDVANLEFRGSLIEPPPCNLNEEDTVKVNFGNKVGVKRVASGNYREPIPLTLLSESSDNISAWQLTLSVSGNPASFDPDNATVVTSEREALGVKLYADGKPFELDSPVKVNGNTLPSLEAVLVQKEGETLNEGEFTAHATLRVAYE
ncbi:fimbrial protein [Pantoea allii]|uniref:fimbrial protein n=1 Tax=Pantoea allii TaxID=574096 RepID=UPI001FC90F3C|nr:fimbrial protein [Pantoea allii]